MGLSKFKDEDFIALLQNAVQHIQNDEDLIEITRLKHLFKKTVPFSRRSYVGCYFAKLILEQGGRIPGVNPRGKNRDSNSQSNRPQGFASPRREQPSKSFSQDDSSKEKQPSRHTIIAESLAATIFISIGKNRRVFPRDLVSLLIQGANMQADRIGEIRVLDNYSFVQLFAEDADKVIAALNGYKFHGRSLVVSYSRKKEETDEAGNPVSEE
jgi:hypothetical protein